MGRKLNLVKMSPNRNLKLNINRKRTHESKSDYLLYSSFTKERKSPNSPPLSKDPEPP
jgi:hypothetical protein